MSVKPRTIDNLGVETSARYAKDKAQLDTKLIEESRFIPLKTEISAVKPYLPTEFEEYLFADKLILWASFQPPPEYFNPSKALFSFQMIPSLGGYEKQEEDEEKLQALEQIIDQEREKGNKDQQESQQEQKERKTLLKLLQIIEKLDRNLSLINSRRNQYQRG